MYVYLDTSRKLGEWSRGQDVHRCGACDRLWRQRKRDLWYHSCDIAEFLEHFCPLRDRRSGRFLYVEMSRNVQSGNTQNLKSMVIQRSFPKWSVAERRKTAAASDQAAVCACAHSRYFTGGSPSGLRV